MYGVRKIIKQSTTKVLARCLNDLFMYLFIQQFFLCQAVFKALGKGSSCSRKTHIMLMLAFGLVLGSCKEKQTIIRVSSNRRLMLDQERLSEVRNPAGERKYVRKRVLRRVCAWCLWSSSDFRTW